MRDLLADLEKSKEELEEKVQARTAELERSNKELEQFAYIASHDLQTPLQSISGFLGLLSRRYQGKLDEEADMYITHAVEGVQRMHKIIDDVLSLSRLKADGKTLKLTSMKKALSEALLYLKKDIKETGATIEHDKLPEVVGDNNQLVLLLQNLIGNSLKYRRKDVQPNIYIAVEKKDSKWHFQINDNGVGFEQEHAVSIFEVFKRLHAYSEYPGTGIGLAICKKIVDHHGGEIRAESEPGMGTTFYFTLPSSTSEQKK